MKTLDTFDQNPKSLNSEKLSHLVSHTSALSLKKLSEKRALDLFHQASLRVPAYKDFLEKNKINPNNINKYKDLLEVPSIDKDNYLRVYPIKDLMWDGVINAPIFSTSSGSSGKPYFWPRSQRLEHETYTIYEYFLTKQFEIDKYSTLLINGYSMGLYVAGSFTLNSCMEVARRGHNKLTTITPGINKQDILKLISSIGHNFEQIVIAAYPPLVKDIVDEGPDWGIDWSKHRMKFFFGGESFSEKWRSNLLKAAQIPEEDILIACMNVYGSADAAILGHETPKSIALRRLLSDNSEVCQELFNRSAMPSVEQYYPFWKCFHVKDKELHFTANAGFPLINYNIKDCGGIIDSEKLNKILKKHHLFESYQDLVPHGFHNNLPFVYLTGRTGGVATIYGLNVYTENIKAGLEHELVYPYVSGKFLLSTQYDNNHNQFLDIKIELKKNVSSEGKLQRYIKKQIYETIRELNAEFRMLSNIMPKKAMPRVKLYTNGHPVHFPPRIKEIYLKK